MTVRFVERENRRAIIGYLQRATAAPLAVYTDHAGHFGQWLATTEERTENDHLASCWASWGSR